jgi:hypothetical protein
VNVRDGQELWRVEPPADAERVERCAADPAGDYVALLSRGALQMLSARSGVPAGPPLPLRRAAGVRAIRDSMHDVTFDGAARPIVTSAGSAYAGPAPLTPARLERELAGVSRRTGVPRNAPLAPVDLTPRGGVSGRASTTP